MDPHNVLMKWKRAPTQGQTCDHIADKKYNQTSWRLVIHRILTFGSNLRSNCSVPCSSGYFGAVSAQSKDWNGRKIATPMLSFTGFAMRGNSHAACQKNNWRSLGLLASRFLGALNLKQNCGLPSLPHVWRPL